ncbi:TFIID-31kDa-domain-containing protein [Tilletiaria anomala UBC 951]|uniref:TFIID-31kDa-domain-containing protein n=1 Tax=Tilletiaria anomala (strain ATCC 24038 / CBS 436.72 / UBC 951) TaxID=1037660 RepID=A0A066WLT0_TILAU|nr:TFIID-31kDa-domain-containing protein [Tilletiaria anomala UBC 951]KDN53553.1 TFIID-31kDa-domain-containing protein [Tilletiaria anomala UBC 951]
MSMTQQHIPRDARLMALIASSMGIQDYEPSALIQLLDFAHRYTYDVLQDAIMYADHASSAAKGIPTSVSLDDLQLAVQSRVNYSFTQPPSKEMLLSLATSLNTMPLPPISDSHGVRLPPRQHRLTNINFNILPNAPPPEVLGDESEDDPIKSEAAPPRSNPAGAASHGRDLDEDDDYDDEEESHGAGSNGANPLAASASAANGNGGDAASSTANAEPRGLKRSLDEDEDYD